MKTIIFALKYLHNTPCSYLSNIRRLPRALEIHNHYQTAYQEKLSIGYQKFVERQESLLLSSRAKKILKKLNEQIFKARFVDRLHNLRQDDNYEK